MYYYSWNNKFLTSSYKWTRNKHEAMLFEERFYREKIQPYGCKKTGKYIIAN
jgi:hypothetical protein